MATEEQLVPQEFFFGASGAGNSLWEIQRPQSIIVKLVEQGVFQGEVLDVGCGIADNAIYIASQVNGIHLTAFDLVRAGFSLLFRAKEDFLRSPKRLKWLVKRLKQRM